MTGQRGRGFSEGRDRGRTSETQQNRNRNETSQERLARIRRESTRHQSTVGDNRQNSFDHLVGEYQRSYQLMTNTEQFLPPEVTQIMHQVDANRLIDYVAQQTASEVTHPNYRRDSLNTRLSQVSLNDASHLNQANLVRNSQHDVHNRTFVDEPSEIRQPHQGDETQNRFHFTPNQVMEFIKQYRVSDNFFSTDNRNNPSSTRDTVPKMRDRIATISHEIDTRSNDLDRLESACQQTLDDIERDKEKGKLLPHGLREATKNLQLHLESANQFDQKVEEKYEDPIDDLDRDIVKSESKLDKETKQLQSQMYLERDNKKRDLQKESEYERNIYWDKREKAYQEEGNAYIGLQNILREIRLKKLEKSRAHPDSFSSFDEDIKHLKEIQDIADREHQNAKNELAKLPQCKEKLAVDNIDKSIAEKRKQIDKEYDDNLNKQKAKIRNREYKLQKPLLKEKLNLLNNYRSEQQDIYGKLLETSRIVVKICDNIRTYQNRIDNIRDSNLRTYMLNPDNPVGLAIDNLETIWQNSTEITSTQRLDRTINNVITHIENVLRTIENSQQTGTFQTDTLQSNLTSLTRTNQELGQIIQYHMELILQRRSNQSNDNSKGKGKAT